ncbi:MAG TPA: cyclic pyranopterin monophosphate synthase MoaC [bacterium]|nr:cyclic pyranopterin monophosphate synthase MoaC [bacterium]
MRRKLTHVDARGQVRMVDVAAKAPSVRRAVARGEVRMKPQTLRLIQQSRIAKGDVLAVAQVAGVSAAKRTDELIPLAHTLPLTAVRLDFTLDDAAGVLGIEATASTVGRTGVEMEALTAVMGAALAIYDMCKAVDRGMTIERVRLVSKTGGRTGAWRREGEQP